MTDSEKGSSPIELALGLGVILIPVAILVLSVAPVFEHNNFARRAAAEAARTLVLATGSPEDEARAVVRDLAAGFGIDQALVEVSFCGGEGCVLARGSVASVEVSVVVPQVSVFLPVGDMTVRATHGEQIDPYRSRP